MQRSNGWSDLEITLYLIPDQHYTIYISPKIIFITPHDPLPRLFLSLLRSSSWRSLSSLLSVDHISVLIARHTSSYHASKLSKSCAPTLPLKHAFSFPRRLPCRLQNSLPAPRKTYLFRSVSKSPKSKRLEPSPQDPKNPPAKPARR